MFEKINKRAFYRRKHLDAPLLEERIQYLELLENNGKSLTTIKTAANYLFRVIEFLGLESKRVITRKEIEKAADAWAQYQYNHPQKRQSFSENSKYLFRLYATDWLKGLNLLEPPPRKTALFYKIFDRSHALNRHLAAPLLEERLMYLRYWKQNGAVDNTLRRIAQYLLVVIKYLEFHQLRAVSVEEINKAADCWAKDNRIYCGKCAYSKFAKRRFIRDAKGWLEMLDCLEQKPKDPVPFEEYLEHYVNYMRHEQGLSESTIKPRISQLRNFLINVHQKDITIFGLTPLIIDEILIKKYNTDSYSRRTVQAYASLTRSFLRHLGNQGWCQIGLADSIKAPRVYKHESIPFSPSWDNVKTILASCEGDYPTNIRDRAMLMLLSIYGLRCSEVTHLRLENIDWKHELIHLTRAKNSKPQTFPLLGTVGEAILHYIKDVRPNNCGLGEVFLCMRSPYRPLSSSAVYRVVSEKLKTIENLCIKHYGPHALRHACATHLINNEVSLKEISDHLGHQSIETTRIYTKVDLTSLCKVADFELGDIL